MTHAWLIAVICASICAVAVQCQVIVNTTSGRVQGDILSLHDGKLIQTFLGITFAKAPIGPLRWQPPQDPDPWQDIFVADTLRAACPQTPSVIILTQPWWREYDEDCLHLNVFAPMDQIGAPYPVMVFMHGGGFTTGAGSQYTGHFLAAKDVVTVFPNYRLDVLGFSTTADSVMPGNYGMLDMVHALRWVQSNIANFGGDPNNVIVFGESAGGAGVGLLIVSSMATDLFHGAILESGCELGWPVISPDRQPEQNMWSLADQLGCDKTDVPAMVDCLRQFNATEIRRASNNCSEQYNCTGFMPNVDGTFLTDMPINIRQTGNFNQVPEIVGINSEDAFIGLGPIIGNGTSQEEFNDYVRRQAVSLTRQFDVPEREEDIYQALRYQYSPWPHLDDEWATGQAVGRIATDGSFGYTMDAQLKLHTDYADTYQYIFSYQPYTPNVDLDYLGAAHMIELPYVFGFPMLQLNENVRNQTGIIDIFNYTDIDIAYSEFVMTLWTNFAKYHNPTPRPVETPIFGQPLTWEPFTKERLSYIFIDNEYIEVEENYRQKYYAFWHSYANWMLTGGPWPFP